MSDRLRSSDRLLQAALQLFVAQGITATTTRQIAELAGVNEVTLFRQFGNKQGLLLAVLKDSAWFTTLGEELGRQAHQAANLDEALYQYAHLQLRAIDQAPEFIRSLIGEAGQYSTETAEALGQTLQHLNRYTTQYLATVLPDRPAALLSTETLAGLFNSALLGYAVLEVATPFHGSWPDRDEFLKQLVTLLQAAVGQRSLVEFRSPLLPQTVADLPDAIVHSLLQHAKKTSLQDYALAYVLFAAGLNGEEIVGLQRSHSLSDRQQHLLMVDRGELRQVPVNQWIAGQRYGSYLRNPLTQWLKSRKDDQPALFINEAGNPLSEVEVRLRWQSWTTDLATATGQPLAIEQAQQTWCVDMLVKGIALEDLSLLTGFAIDQLHPYAQRAKEKAAIERALQLDQKS